MDYNKRHKLAVKVYNDGLEKVKTTQYPVNQKFPPGARVKINKDLGESCSHFPSDRFATVKYTYAHAYGGDNVNSYCLDVDGIGEVSWYREHQLQICNNNAL